VEAIEDFGQGQMSGCRSLKIIEEENHLHPRAGEVFNLRGQNGMIQGAPDLLDWIINPGHREFILIGNEIPSLRKGKGKFLSFVIYVTVHLDPSSFLMLFMVTFRVLI
jgi:hypothetical protein